MNGIIFEKYNGETFTVVIDGKEYPNEVVDNWSPEDFIKIRDEMLLKCQRESKARASSIYDAFEPYIINSEVKQARSDAKIDLAQMICRMPKEDVIAVFTSYFDELPNITNGDDSKK